MQKQNVYFSTDKYGKLTDEQLIEKIKDGEEEACSFLLERYRDLVNMKVSRYFIVGAEKEDIFQEGIKTFDETKQNSFKTFANMCVERQLITAIKSSNRQKHMPLNSSLSLNISAYDNSEDENSTELMETFNNKTAEDPLETIMKKEYYKEMQNAITKHLSKFEKKVLLKVKVIQ